MDICDHTSHHSRLKWIQYFDFQYILHGYLPIIVTWIDRFQLSIVTTKNFIQSLIWLFDVNECINHGVWVWFIATIVALICSLFDLSVDALVSKISLRWLRNVIVWISVERKITSFQQEAFINDSIFIKFQMRTEEV